MAVDYGEKLNILRNLASAGCRVTVVPATASTEDILATSPTGFSSPTAPAIRPPRANTPSPQSKVYWTSACRCSASAWGISSWPCHSVLRTYKLARGHRGANQPVKDLATGRVEITSQNHGFAVDADTLPSGASVTHVSLFDGSNEGLSCVDRPAFSVQDHPEASPGPSDSTHLFDRFVAMMEFNGDPPGSRVGRGVRGRGGG